MKEFLRNFDPIREKYEFRTWNADYQSWLKGRRIRLTAEGRANVSVFEDSFQFGSLSKQKYSSILDNLKLVYGDADLIHGDVRDYHMAERKIVHSYLAIPQLDKMFDEDYFNFEWDMHVGQNFNEHRSDYYRDHFIHQIRDMYMMLVLMEEFGMYHAVREVLSDRMASNISAYVTKKKQQFMDGAGSPIFRKLLELCEKKQLQVPEIDSSAYVEEYFNNYVIKASCILAGLFHDLGYPICHFLHMRNRLSNYNPTMYMVTHNEIGSFDQIASVLSPSLLFSLVSLKGIKAALELNSKGTFDHGAYSAIAFLLQFYENGIINSLSPEKQCAIELAAVAIFNHTIEYKATKENSKSNYYSLYFRQNPIAFLLRVCDDLQEWDRRYFEVSESSDLMFCEECHTPLIKYKLSAKDKKPSVDLFVNDKNPGVDTSTKEKLLDTVLFETYENEVSGYQCSCRSMIRRPDIFMKRKLYLVSVADTVSVTDSAENGKHVLHADVNYNLYKMLMMANINNTYAKFRFKELVGLQHLLEGQNYGKTFLRFELGFFMSPNPISIKLEILRRFIERFPVVYGNNTPEENYSKKLDLLYARPKRLLDNIINISWTIPYEDILKDNREIANVKSIEDIKKGIIEKRKIIEGIKEVLGCCIKFYISLLIISERPKSRRTYYNDAISQHSRSNPFYCEIMNALTSDALQSLEDRRKKWEYADPDKEATLYNSISAYTCAQNSFNSYKEILNSLDCGFPYIGYYFDIYIFKKLCDKLDKAADGDA